MFNIHDECPSFELCKHLKEIGYPQDRGGFYWIKESKNYSLKYFDKAIPNSNVESYRAPLCNEMAECLPRLIRIFPNISLVKEWNINFYSKDINPSSMTFMKNKTIKFVDDLNLPNSLAKMIIWLIENKYKLDKIHMK